MRPTRWLPELVVGLMLAPVLFLTRADPDLWGHVRFGLDILARQTLPSVDPYSFTQDVPWINHEWLSEALMGAAYRVGGAPGLALLKGALVATFFAIVLTAYGRVSPTAAAVVLLILGAGTGRVTTTLRPQIWTLIGVALICRLFVSGPRRWWLAALPMLFGLWVNLHGGWIVGAGLLALWTGGQIWRPQRSRGFAISAALLSALGTLINPYGWGMWKFLAGTVRMSRQISDWQPLATTPVLNWIPWAVIVVGVAASLRFRERPGADRVAMVGLLGYGAFRVERLAPLLVAAALVFLSPIARARWPAGARRFDPLAPAGAAIFWVAAVGLVAASAFAVARTAACIPIAGTWSPDRVAGQALAASNAKGKIVTWFDWGEYAIWHLAPGLEVSMDGRRETIYSDATLAAHEAMNAGTDAGLAYLERLDPDYVWLPADRTRVRDWLATHSYRIDVETADSFVGVRADLPPVAAGPAPPPGCFPGP